MSPLNPRIPFLVIREGGNPPELSPVASSPPFISLRFNELQRLHALLQFPHRDTPPSQSPFVVLSPCHVR